MENWIPWLCAMVISAVASVLWLFGMAAHLAIFTASGLLAMAACAAVYVMRWVRWRAMRRYMAQSTSR